MITRANQAPAPVIIDSRTGRPVVGPTESIPEAALRQLRKVLAMAGRPESPEQSAAAAAVAEKILRKYDLTLVAAAVLGGMETGQDNNAVIAHCVYACGLKVWNWVKVVVSAVTMAHHCHTDIIQIVDESGRVDHIEFVCYGTMEDTALVRQIVGLIVSQIELGAAFYKGRDRHSFRAGAAFAVGSRIEAAHREAEVEVKATLQDRLKLSAARAGEVVETALAVLDKRREHAQAAADAVLSETGSAPRSGSSKRDRGYANLKPRDPNGFADGYAAGMDMRIQLAQELQPGPG